MTRSQALLATLLVLFATAAAQASTIDALSLEDLQDQSAVVVLGEVVSSDSRSEGNRIVTYSEIDVSLCLAGLCPDDVTVTSPGGEVGGLVDHVEGAAYLRNGQEVLLFLRPSEGNFAVVGMSQGFFVVERNSGQDAVAISDRTGLNMVEPTGRPSLTDRVAYPLDELVDAIRLGTPVQPLALNND